MYFKREKEAVLAQFHASGLRVHTACRELPGFPCDETLRKWLDGGGLRGVRRRARRLHRLVPRPQAQEGTGMEDDTRASRGDGGHRLRCPKNVRLPKVMKAFSTRIEKESSEFIYNSEEICKLSDKNSPIAQANRLCHLAKHFLKSHSGLKKDNRRSSPPPSA